MDYIAAANEALEKRARAFEARKAAMEDSTLTDADRRSRIEAIDAEMDALARRADEYVRAAEREAEVRELEARAARLANSGANGAPGRQDSRGMDEAATLRAIARGEVREAEFRAPEGPSTTSGAGAALAPTSFMAQVQEAMYERSELYRRMRTLVTESGETIELPVKVRTAGGRAVTPKSPATSFAATEGSAITKGETEWATVDVGSYKRGVIVQATREIVEDSRIDILSHLAQDAGADLMDEMANLLVMGSGSSEPLGWVYYTQSQTSNAGPSDIANLAALDFDDVIDLEYSLPAPYRRNAVFLAADAAVPHLRKLKDSNGAYIWQPSLTAGAPDTLSGHPLLTDPNMVTSGSDKAVLVFGDPSKHLVRIVRGVRVSRSDEYGWDSDLISFKVTIRFDSVQTDARSVRRLRVDS